MRSSVGTERLFNFNFFINFSSSGACCSGWYNFLDMRFMRNSNVFSFFFMGAGPRDKNFISTSKIVVLLQVVERMELVAMGALCLRGISSVATVIRRRSVFSFGFLA